MNATVPACSLIIPTFERPALIERAVGSALAQTHKAAEIFVVDDGSSCDYSTALCRLDPTIRIIRLPHNGGPAAARNAGIQASNSPIVAFLDDDDELSRDFLEVTVRALSSSPPRVGLSWTGVVVQSAASGRSWTRDFFDNIHNEESLLRAFLAIGLGHGVAIKRDCAMRVGAFSTELRLVEDTEWFLRFLSLGFRPMPIRGAHVTVHCHAGPRMTDSTLHLARRRECERLLETMQSALASFPFLREQIQNVVGLSGAGAWQTSVSVRGMANAASKR